MTGEAREEEVRASFAKQAVWCTRLGSPFTGALMGGLATGLTRASEAGRIILDWDGQPDALGDAVALRLAGALHGLVRRGRLPELARLYPPAPLPDPDLLLSTALAAIEDADEEIVQWLTHPPQTNEIARSVVLYAGLSVIAAELHMPLSLYEIGASAGLNLFPDRLAYDIGGRLFGDASSKVRLAPKWNGDVPFIQEITIAGRRGCDRNPLNVCDPADAERLVAYIWPDQPERLARTQAAIEIARADPPRIDKADAADWVDEMFGQTGEPGVARILFHTIAFQYFPEEIKERIRSCMSDAGAQATSEAPLAWLCFELGKDNRPELTLQLWPGGEPRLLARADPHCHEATWLEPVR